MILEGEEEEEAAEEEGGEEKAAEEGGEEKTEEGGKKKTTEGEKKTGTEEEKEKSKTPYIVGGVAVVALVGGLVACKMCKGSDDNEGGEAESRTLFKK